MKLTTAQKDRAEGVLLATAAGDALGAPYEFKPPRGPELEVAMVGGGGWEAGEWTDDTSMAIAIAEVAATGANLLTEPAQDAVVKRWHIWSRGAKDVGNQTRSVLSEVSAQGGWAATALAVSERLYEQTRHTGGNGALMRTAPVALAYLGANDEHALVAAARAISDLTHFDPDARDACVLWCSAIRYAVLTGKLGIRKGLCHIETGRRDLWTSRLAAAEQSRPADFPNNGWVVTAMQAAWSAIATTPVPVDDPVSGLFRADHLRVALDAAVRAGYDTDTVAAIAGGLLGAVHGASAVPSSWRRLLHGWPGITSRGLVGLAAAIGLDGKPDTFDLTYPGLTEGDVAVRHPYDDHVWLGGVGALRALPGGIPDHVDAVVSLCSVADEDIPQGAEHVDVRLIDSPRSDENVNLDFVLLDTVRLIEQFRAEGKTVLVHCVQAHSRTPAIGTLYGARLRGIGAGQALDDVSAVLPNAYPNSAFKAALRRLQSAPRGPG